MKDETLTIRSWPLAKVVEVFPGPDGRVRAVDLLCRGKKYRRSSHNLIFLEMEEDHNLPPPPEHVHNLPPREHVQDQKIALNNKSED